jgi:hypothetical protein
MKPHESDLSVELMNFLKQYGLSRRRMERCSRATKLWHDLGEYGEAAEDIIEEFSEAFHVDLSGFDFHKYFPSEWISDSLIISNLARMVPFLEYFIRMRGEYAPLTLGMLDDAILSKKLV